MDEFELYRKKVEAVELMRKRNFQSSTIVQVLEEESAVLYLLNNPEELEGIVLSIAQKE